jgi:hypothetical protein
MVDMVVVMALCTPPQDEWNIVMNIHLGQVSDEMKFEAEAL